MRVKVNQDYEAARRKAYGEITDQLDILWEVVKGLPSSQIPQSARDFLQKRDNIKMKFPKKNGKGNGNAVNLSSISKGVVK